MATKYRNRLSSTVALLAGASAGGLLLPGLSLAQQQSGGVLEEIVVTATRHEESLSKVPISVTALSQETLDLKGIKDFQDIVRFTPGVTIDNSGTNAISIRGISSSGGAGTTGIYIDDTPIQMRAVGFNPDDTLPKTFDLDRVEVLRGPQGTLFGSGSEGGTVRYIMTQPSVTKDSTYARGEVSFTRGGQPSYEAGVAQGGPLIDNVLGFRASVWYRYDGGWMDRVDPTTRAVTDRYSNRANTINARLAFLWKPSEAVSVTPSFMYQNSRKHDESTYWPAYSTDSQFNNATPERQPVPDEYYLPSLKIEASLGKTRLVSNTSFYHRKEITAYQGSAYDFAFYQSQQWLIGQCGTAVRRPTDPQPPQQPGSCPWYPLIDGSGIHLPIDPATGTDFSGYATPNTITNQQDTFTQEVRLQSDDPTSAWTWTVGAFWSVSKERSVEELRDDNMIAFWQALFGIDPRDYFGGQFYSCNGVGTLDPISTVPNCDNYINNNVVHDHQIAGFGEVTYAFTERFKGTLGARVARMTFDMVHHGDGLLNYGPDDATAAQKENSFTPKVSLSFQADPNNLFYFTYAKGFRPGGGNPALPSYCDGFNGLAQTGYADGAPLSYKSDTTQSYEIGTKNNFGGKVRLATSVYWIKWNDIQQSVYVPYNCGLQFTDNLGTAVAKGFDFQAEMVLGGGFSMDAAFGYTDARYTKSTILKGLIPDPNDPDPQNPTLPPIPVDVILAAKGDAISGEAAIDGGPGTNPPWTASIGAQYNWNAGGHDAFVRLDWEYTARNNWPATVQDPTTTQYSPFTYTLPSTKFASLRAGLNVGSVQLAFFVDNLFDSRTVINYQLSQNDANGPTGLSDSVQQNAYTFRPRTFGITATYRR